MGAVRKVRRSIRSANRDRKRENLKLRDWYSRGVGDTNYVAGEVGDYLNKQNGVINSGYSNTGNQINAANASLQGQLVQTSQGNAADAQAEQQRLGIQQSGLGGFQQDANFASLMAQNNAQNEQANNSMAGQNASAVGSLLLGMNQGQRQANIGQLLNTRNEGITNNNNAFSEYRIKAREQINDILAQQAAAAAARRSSRSSYGSSGSGGGSSYYPGNVQSQLGLLGALMNGGSRKPKPKPKTGNPADPISGFMDYFHGTP